MSKFTRRGKVVIALTIVMSLFLVAGVGASVYLRSVGFWGSSDPGTEVEFEIPNGSDAAEIGKILEAEGIIKSAFGFRLAAYFDGGAEDIQAGKYTLATGLTARDALERLKGTEPEGELHVNVTFPEGLWLTEMAETMGEDTHISAKKFLKLATSGRIRSEFLPEGIDTLEGLLFPSTYQVIEKDSARDVIERLLGEFEKQVESLDFSQAESLGLSNYEIVIVASMIEAETRVDAERAKVAQVIYNRIRAGWMLGIDATVLYALGDRHAELTQSALDVDSPYNTRRYTDIPPTPIGAPGRASLEAALNPADGAWMYYVLADCEGNHAFSTTDAEFLEDKAHYQTLDCG
ncbi:MAG: endolytic transglycosylase MltG [Actinobacteria bacterium]|nr:endolytic transglycosylase MltG [Actinomycetota bacterium]